MQLRSVNIEEEWVQQLIEDFGKMTSLLRNIQYVFS